MEFQDNGSSTSELLMDMKKPEIKFPNFSLDFEMSIDE